MTSGLLSGHCQVGLSHLEVIHNVGTLGGIGGSFDLSVNKGGFKNGRFCHILSLCQVLTGLRSIRAKNGNGRAFSPEYSCA